MARDEPRSKPATAFDAVAASEVMRELADQAEQRVEEGTPLDRELVRRAFASLRAAQAWLETSLVDFDIRIQRPLVTGKEDPDRIGADVLAATLRQAAVVLLQVQKFLDLRGPRQR